MFIYTVNSPSIVGPATLAYEFQSNAQAKMLEEAIELLQEESKRAGSFTDVSLIVSENGFTILTNTLDHVKVLWTLTVIED